MKKRIFGGGDPHKKIHAPAFVVEEGKRAIDAKTLMVVFGCAAVHDLVRRIERRMVACYALGKDFIPDEQASEIIDQCDEVLIRKLATERIKQVAIDYIITNPESGKRLFLEAEELRKRRNSVDRLLEEIGG